jgi:hypothetical protein
MRKFFYSLVLIGIAGTLRQAHAANITVIKEPVAIPAGQTREFDFGTVPQAGTTVLLKIRSRINSKSLAGSWMVMKVELNGHEVQAQKSRTAIRLTNKPLISPVTPTKSATWYSPTQGWRALYAPDFNGALKESYYVDDPYTLVLDVTDLTNPVAENRLKITNTASANIKAFSENDAALVIGSLELETKSVASPMMAISNGKTILNRGEPGAGTAAYQGEILPGGGFALNIGKSTFNFSSAFSYPNAGFNHLAAERGNQKNWQVKVDARAGRVVARGADYRIVRTLHFGKTHVEIADAITNLHADAPLGMSVRNEMDISGIKDPQVRLAGDLMQNNYYAPGNPSVHVIVPSGAIGIIAEDNVLRNQAILYTQEPATAGMRTDMFCLAPGETYTLHWAVYPVAGPDYYDFINLVRDDWKANITVPGGVMWLSAPDSILGRSLSAIRTSLQLSGIRYVMITGSWVDHLLDPKTPGTPGTLGFGTAVFEPHFADYRRRIIEATQKLHEASPEIKVLGYYDVQRDSSEDSPQKFNDSWLTDADGKQLSTDWSGKFNRSYSVVPALENSFGKAALTAAKRYMDELGLDGIYWDEMEGTGFNAPQLTYNMRDGHTCILDPQTWTIKREAGLTTLVSLPFRLSIIHEIQDKGGILLGNGSTKTIDELNTGILRMVEIQHNDEIPHQGDLQTPYGFMGSNSSWQDFLRAFSLAKLPIGVIPGVKNTWINRYSNDIMPSLFPFTPIELHAGYLLGKERIIATHSGNYGWHGEKVLSLTRHFDENGKLTEKHFPIACSNEGVKSVVQLNENEAAVLIRLPMTFAPGTKVLLPSWSASLTVNEYDADKISLDINAPHGGVLTIDNIANDKPMQAHLNGKAQPLSVHGNQLKIQIPSGFVGKCELR